MPGSNEVHTGVKPHFLYLRYTTMLDLPLSDLHKNGGGAWNLKSKVNWKLSKIEGEELVVVYEKNSGTGKDPGTGGMLFTSCPHELDPLGAKMHFDVKFDHGFKFETGGKIGGFFCGEGEADGYRHCPTASSCRMMWRENGSCVSYIYPPQGVKQTDPKLNCDGCGIDRNEFPHGVLKPGEWHAITIGLKMNTFDSAGKPRHDGIAFFSVNGVAKSLGGVVWAASAKYPITSFTFNTFFGGGCVAPGRCTTRFKNFKLSKY